MDIMGISWALPGLFFKTHQPGQRTTAPFGAALVNPRLGITMPNVTIVQPRLTHFRYRVLGRELIKRGRDGSFGFMSIAKSDRCSVLSARPPTATVKADTLALRLRANWRPEQVQQNLYSITSSEGEQATGGASKAGQ